MTTKQEMNPALKEAKAQVAKAKARLTRAKNAHKPLAELIELNRAIDAAKAVEQRCYQYQFSLDAAGVADLTGARAFLLTYGVEI